MYSNKATANKEITNLLLKDKGEDYLKLNLVYGDIPSDIMANSRSDTSKEVQLAQRQKKMWEIKAPEARIMIKRLVERKFGNNC